MSTTTAYLQMAYEMFQRNNPFMEAVQRLYSLITFMMTYQSNIKLNKYRQTLYAQQLERMENYISAGSPYRSIRGERIDRRF